jgi:predicted negative regulator of RcsB-dependent stress response
MNMPKRDTGTFSAIDPDGVRTCALHRETCNDIYRAINARVSLRYVALLCGVAVAFGVALFGWTTWRCDRTDEVTAEMRDRVIKIEADLEHIKAAQADMKTEQKEFRADIMAEFKALRALVKREP